MRGHGILPWSFARFCPGIRGVAMACSAHADHRRPRPRACTKRRRGRRGGGRVFRLPKANRFRAYSGMPWPSRWRHISSANRARSGISIRPSAVKLVLLTLVEARVQGLGGVGDCLEARGGLGEIGRPWRPDDRPATCARRDRGRPSSPASRPCAFSRCRGRRIQTGPRAFPGPGSAEAGLHAGELGVEHGLTVGGPMLHSLHSRRPGLVGRPRRLRRRGTVRKRRRLSGERQDANSCAVPS